MSEKELLDFLLKQKIPEEKAGRLMEYRRFLLEENKRINLLAAGEGPVFFHRHLLDSLMGIPLLQGVKGPWADLGSGGGLPGIPLAVCLESRPVYLIEARQKKADFLQKAIEKLDLKDVFVLDSRAEELGRQEEWRNNFSVVLARGIAAFPVLLELSLPLLQEAGKLLAWKGPGLDEEMKKSRGALDILGGKKERLWEYELEGRKGFIQVIKKVAPTPQRYPRRTAALKKRPLNVDKNV